jgi:hypothetical protein
MQQQHAQQQQQVPGASDSQNVVKLMANRVRLMPPRCLVVQSVDVRVEAGAPSAGGNTHLVASWCTSWNSCTVHVILTLLGHHWLFVTSSGPQPAKLCSMLPAMFPWFCCFITKYNVFANLPAMFSGVCCFDTKEQHVCNAACHVPLGILPHTKYNMCVMLPAMFPWFCCRSVAQEPVMS